MHQIRNALSLIIRICFLRKAQNIAYRKKKPHYGLSEQTTTKCLEHGRHRFVQSHGPKCLPAASWLTKHLSHVCSVSLPSCVQTALHLGRSTKQLLRWKALRLLGFRPFGPSSRTLGQRQASLGRFPRTGVRLDVKSTAQRRKSPRPACDVSKQTGIGVFCWRGGVRREGRSQHLQKVEGHGGPTGTSAPYHTSEAS